MQSISPLAADDCSVNDTMVKVVPFLNRSFFRMINVTDPTAVLSLLQNALSAARQQAINGSN